MARRFLLRNLSSEELTLDAIGDWYNFQDDLIGAEKVRVLESLAAGTPITEARYFARTPDELDELFAHQRAELANTAMLNLLAATEAAVRVDFLFRVANKKKDELSKQFGQLYKEHERKVPLGGILDCWKEGATPATKTALDHFGGALKLRNWLAHGRYWTLRTTRSLDIQEVSSICQALLERTVLT